MSTLVVISRYTSSSGRRAAGNALSTTFEQTRDTSPAYKLTCRCLKLAGRQTALLCRCLTKYVRLLVPRFATSSVKSTTPRASRIEVIPLFAICASGHQASS